MQIVLHARGCTSDPVDGPYTPIDRSGEPPLPTSRVGLTDAIVTAIEPPETSELFVWDSVCAGRAVYSSVRSWPVAVTERRKLSGRSCSEAGSQTRNGRGREPTAASHLRAVVLIFPTTESDRPRTAGCQHPVVTMAIPARRRNQRRQTVAQFEGRQHQTHAAAWTQLDALVDQLPGVDFTPTLQREVRTSAGATDVPGRGGQPLRWASWRRRCRQNLQPVVEASCQSRQVKRYQIDIIRFLGAWQDSGAFCALFSCKIGFTRSAPGNRVLAYFFFGPRLPTTAVLIGGS
jgi:hypothetical protein